MCLCLCSFVSFAVDALPLFATNGNGCACVLILYVSFSHFSQPQSGANLLCCKKRLTSFSSFFLFSFSSPFSFASLHHLFPSSSVVFHAFAYSSKAHP